MLRNFIRGRNFSLNYGGTKPAINFLSDKLPKVDYYRNALSERNIFLNWREFKIVGGKFEQDIDSVITVEAYGSKK